MPGIINAIPLYNKDFQVLRTKLITKNITETRINPHNKTAIDINPILDMTVPKKKSCILNSPFYFTTSFPCPLHHHYTSNSIFCLRFVVGFKLISTNESNGSFQYILLYFKNNSKMLYLKNTK